MGPYPLFFCRDWSRLSDDLLALAPDLVSVVLVTDPFLDIDSGSLNHCFNRVVRFKEHYVVDLDQSPEFFVKASHRVSARRALRKVDVCVCERPSERLDVWLELFANLSRRHDIRGLRAFSRRAFETQLRIPGLVMFEATVDGDAVGLDLWYVQGEVAYGHLAAFSPLGYEVGASYATKWTMLEYFADRVGWLDLGGGAGLADAKADGLARFKAGWSTGTRPVYLCGRILQPGAYEDLARVNGGCDTGYFPAYRHGELA